MKSSRYNTRVGECVLQVTMIALLAGWGLSAHAYSISWGTGTNTNTVIDGGGTTTTTAAEGEGTTTVTDGDPTGNDPDGDLKRVPCTGLNNDVCGVTGLSSAINNAAALEAAFGGAFTDSLSAVTLAYKNNVEGGEETLDFAGSYSTTFTSSRDGATLTYDSGSSLTCPDCYLLVKDGSASPNQYLFALTGWDGTSTITLTNFFADTDPTGNNGGSISHISIWNHVDGGGPPNEIPEPTSLGLVGLALAGLGWTRARRRRNG